MEQKQNWKDRNPSYQKEYYEKNKDRINRQKKECREKRSEHYSEVAKIRYNTNKDQILEKYRKFRKENPERILFRLAKQRAKKKGIEFDIEVSDISIPDTCPLLGIYLETSEEKVSEHSPTLDKINPDLGYVKGNVWVISFKANMIKNCATFDEFQTIAINWKKLHEQRKADD